MYNLTKYSDNYTHVLWQNFRDEPVIDANDAITGFNATNATTDLFKIKEKITDKTNNDGTKNNKIKVPLKYLRNFWRTLEC